jgi:L-cysteate sulfo-lyase
MWLDRFPRVSLAHIPTPLEELRNLTTLLGGPRLLIKRDDSTGLALGGNKVRKLEFLMADALANHADTIITTGMVQSNHCRQTAAAAAKLQMECVIMLVGEEPKLDKGNLLLDHLLGAEIRFISTRMDAAEEMARVAYDLRAGGARPYIIPGGGSNEIGSLGYVVLAKEIHKQTSELDFSPDYVIAASSSGGTQAGLVVGFEDIDSPTRVLGVSVGPTKNDLENNVYKLARRTAKFVGLGRSVPRRNVISYDNYVGAGYGVPTAGMLEAIGLLASTEGILLDPVYTGKAMAGLIDLVRKCHFTAQDTVIFIHTGGIPAIFAYESLFQRGQET